MGPGVIAHVIIDAFAPGVAPSVDFEEILYHRRRIVAFVEIDCASIDDQRPSGMIGDDAIVLEADGMRLSLSSEFGSVSFSGAPEARGALSIFLQVLKDRHDRPLSPSDNPSIASQPSR